MVDYHMFCEIKRLYNEKKLNANQIGKVLGIDQKTAVRWIRMERFVKNTPKARASILEPYKGRITHLLEAYNYSSEQIFNMLKEEGYKGSYSVVSHYVSKVRPSSKKVYLTLDFEKGEAGQVDFASCGHICLEHSKRKLYAFIMTLCYSRMMYVEFIYSQGQEHFLQCHRNAFEYFAGVPKSVIVDNCKTAVTEHTYYGDIKLNPHYLDFARHYGFKIKACKVRCPNEKGQVEKAVDYLKRNFLNGKEITSLEAANNAVRYWLENTANVRNHRSTLKRPTDLLEEERSELIPVNLPYDCGQIKRVRADSFFRVTFETNRYSVPSDFASSTLTAKIYPDRLLFYYEDNLISQHIRSYDKNQDFENPEHVRKLLEYKKNARDQKMLKFFFLICPNAEKYYTELKLKRLNSKDHVRKILALSELYGNEKVASAINDALELGAFSSQYICNLLEQRGRLVSEMSPLHLTRNSDCLEIELEQPDLNIYNSHGAI